jgi:hypothetical protein
MERSHYNISSIVDLAKNPSFLFLLVRMAIVATIEPQDRSSTHKPTTEEIRITVRYLNIADQANVHNLSVNQAHAARRAFPRTYCGMSPVRDVFPMLRNDKLVSCNLKPERINGTFLMSRHDREAPQVCQSITWEWSQPTSRKLAQDFLVSFTGIVQVHGTFMSRETVGGRIHSFLLLHLHFSMNGAHSISV